MTFLNRKRKIRGLRFNISAIPLEQIARAMFGMPNKTVPFNVYADPDDA